MSFQHRNDEDLVGDWRNATSDFTHVRSLRQSIADFATQLERSCTPGFDRAPSQRPVPRLSEIPVARPRRSTVHNLQTWVQQRVGTRSNQVILIGFFLVDSAKIVLTERVFDEEINSASLFVVVHLIFLMTAIPPVLNYCDTAGQAIRKVFDVHALWRAGIISCLFVFAKFSTVYSYHTGINPILEKTLGTMYMPFAASLSVILFRRHYGQLEKLAMLMMFMATATFILIRERCRQSEVKGKCVEGFGADDIVFGDGSWGQLYIKFAGYVWVLIACFSSVLASLLAERMTKGQSAGLLRLELTEPSQGEHFSIHFAHLGVCQLLLCIINWVFPEWNTALGQSGTFDRRSGVGWFGNWTIWEYLMVVVMVVQMWGAAFVAKNLSTTVRSVVCSLCVIVVTCIFDPFFEDYDFRAVMGPSICMFIIFSLSALIFQTGRINILAIQQCMEEPKKPEIVELSVRNLIRELSQRRTTGGYATTFPRISTGEMEDEPETFAARFIAMLRKYWCIIGYIVADATRTELQTLAMGKTMITPQSMAVMVNGCSLILFNVMVFTGPRQDSTGIQDLMYAWDTRKILKFLPCGLCFAATSALMSMAMGLGISGSMAVIVGKVYTPACALGSCFVMGKFYIWLEWFAIIILTLGSVSFGLLQNSNVSLSFRDLVPIICVIGAAVASALNSLLMEKMMKTETDPFNIQKIRLDCGAVLCSIAFLPVMGFLADPVHFPQGAFWLHRPLTRNCARLGNCTSAGEFTFHDSASAENNACSCDKGVFVCWDDTSNVALYLLLACAVLHSTVTGMVVKKFSSVYRAVADSFSLLLIYFVGDPLLHGTPLDDAAINLTALILPVSSQLFSQATEELRKVRETKKEIRTRAATAATDATQSLTPRGCRPP